jgi:hypothetical protein
VDARQAWERAIEAKGGRRLLHNVRSVLISTNQRGIRWLRGAPLHCETLLVLPSGLWVWGDQRPSKFGLSVWVVNLETSFKQYIHHVEGQPDEPNPAGRPTPKDKSDIRQLQLFPFMETAWLQPKIRRAWKESHWPRTEIVVETEVDGDIYEWHLDSRSYLPRRLIKKVWITSRWVWMEDHWHVNEYGFEDYRSVDGLLLPHRLKRSIVDTLAPYGERFEYKLNVDYDESIFNKAPSIAAGPEAWMRKDSPALQRR